MCSTVAMGAPPTRVVGIVLAAGAGERAGGAKALRLDGDRMPWLARAATALREGGCDSIIVVLGAGADRARDLVPPGATVVVAADWADGLSASLKAGLAAARRFDDASAALLTLVDLPNLPAAAVARLLTEPLAVTTLRRATYAGQPGHPVVIGREHWVAAATSAEGDRGAGSYLKDQGAELVDCSDLWDGSDVDGPEVEGFDAAPPV
jgi:CTP:molybdopterin cytidylyltransferase MocA